MLKIAIVGPESTGKSELSQALAAYYGGVYVAEYARNYVEQLNRDYNWEDVCEIARKQIEEQAVYLNTTDQPPVVFFDTELIITKVWLEHCYHQVPAFVESSIATGYFDFYLLCFPDLPWVYDPVREHGGDERMYFYDWYKREIEKTGTSYAIITGVGEDRTHCAIANISARFFT